VSYGSAFLKAAIGAAKKLAQEIRERGTVTSLKEALTTPEVAALVRKGK
jgi:2-methylisocitrate lyase-like PEP mutase family enzyme